MSASSDLNQFELRHFEDAVNAGAARARSLWLGYVALLTYLVITVGTVTHRDLFLENPVKLPVLNIDLSLIGFFTVAPIFFIINHFYLLMNLVGLRRRLRAYNRAVKRYVKQAHLRPMHEGKRRLKLDTFVLVQAFGGDRATKAGLNGWLLWLILIITLVVAPIGFLLQVQLVFLPYHNELITWLHRLALLIDLWLLAVFWRVLMTGAPRLRMLPTVMERRSLASLTFGVLVLSLSVFVFTFPGERIDHSGVGGKNLLTAENWETPEDFLLWPMKQLITRTLILDGEHLIDHDLHQKIQFRRPIGEQSYEGERTLQLSRLGSGHGRNFIGASMVNADLRGADFSLARFEGANLSFARLQGANFRGANLRGAKLERASLGGASFRGAKIVGANLKRARLQGANFHSANMQGVNLFRAGLEGANLGLVDLRGADLGRAKLAGAYLFKANLNGTDLWRTDLRGANLSQANLQSADLHRSNLLGADLSGVELEGARVWVVNLRLARLTTTHIWRASGEHNLAIACPEDPRLEAVSASQLLKLKIKTELEAKSSDMVARILTHPSRIDPNDQFIWSSEASKLRDEQKCSDSALQDFLIEIGCDLEFRPYIAQNLSERLAETMRDRPITYKVAKLFLKAAKSQDVDGDHNCPGAVGVADWAINRYKKVVDRFSEIN